MIAVMSKEKPQKSDRPDSDEKAAINCMVRLTPTHHEQVSEIAKVERVSRRAVLESLLNQSPIKDRFRAAVQRKVAEGSKQLKEL